MSNREFTATRTMLANAMATAGAELLEYMGVGGALAAIPNTEPQQYVVAGTLPLIAKLLPHASITPLTAPAPLTDDALRKLCDQLDGMKRRMRHTPGTGQNHSYLLAEDVDAYVEEARKSQSAVPAPQQSELTGEQWIFDLAAEHEANRDGLYGPVTFDATGLVDFARAIEREVAKAAPAAPVQTAETSFAGWYVRKDSDGAIVVQKPKRGGCVLGGHHDDAENIEHTIFYAFLNDLLATQVQAEQAQAEPVDIDSSDFMDLLSKFAHEASCEQYDEAEYKAARKGIIDHIKAAYAALPAQAEQAEAVRAAAFREAANIARCYDLGTPDGHTIANVLESMAAAPSTATSNDTGALGGKGAES